MMGALSTTASPASGSQAAVCSSLRSSEHSGSPGHQEEAAQGQVD